LCRVRQPGAGFQSIISQTSTFPATARHRATGKACTLLPSGIKTLTCSRACNMRVVGPCRNCR
jgi:hypothetical protein